MKDSGAAPAPRYPGGSKPAAAAAGAAAKPAVSAAIGRVELYTQRAMVNWLSPLQLPFTAMRVAVAMAVGTFADQRMVQAALSTLNPNPPIPVPADEQGGVWVDYLSDTGDGWDSTYSMALCVSHGVTVRDQGVTLPRSKVLLLGGDQVYPTPAHDGYRSRFVDPFRAAFPAPVEAAQPAYSDQQIQLPDAPWMVATPGNHDWYDGLRGFARLFCSGKSVGGWETRQRTGYYALQLPGGWWIWGLDLQLESEIDRPQREYFQKMLAELQPGDRVVLCAPEASWVDEMERVRRGERRAVPSIEIKTPRFRSLSEIEGMLGDRLALVLAGNSHHFAHYVPKEGTAGPHRITCGGGGAFLHGTHLLPDPPRPIVVGPARQFYELKAAYPEKATSRQLRNRAWQLPGRNLSFCALVASVYLLFGWIVQSASLVPLPGSNHRGFVQRLLDLEVTFGNIGEVYRELFRVMAHSPASVLFVAAIVFCCGALSTRDVRRGVGLACVVGALHGLLHLALAVAMLWLVTRFNLHGFGADKPPPMLLFLVEAMLLGGTVGGLLFGGWMVLGNALWRLHPEEVFSSQRIADYKCFLRMRFEDGQLTIYPLKLEKVCRKWKLGEGVRRLAKVRGTWRVRAQPGASGPRFVPADGELSPPEAVQMIEEKAIIIPR
ncbi:preprotein translocase subunit YajC [Cupriavidus consociatus]|uniref:preprotein translocase subunit YajC n=1 Tax=Cupriavidus consociatus TaxID=2821357 RepID=UPI001AE8CC32|nr:MULTISPECIES: preprotein translocase subunit YajC [unclassified Cupriavidus]MBP0618913.1 preprotein translocase subunit YajC [Cupriavidus sp. LEh25]MDK2655556.1 preprotein translocase subunit YajC [Cupriavidus sp. LEh21]